MRKKKSKIAIVTECPYVGVFRAVEDLADILRNMGFEVTFVLPQTPRNRYGQNQREQEKKLSKYGLITHIPLRRKYRYLFFDLIKYLIFFRKNYYDIIISFTEYAGKLNRICYLLNHRQKHYHSHQCVDVYRKNGLTFYFELFVEKLLKNLTDYYISCGPSETSILVDKLGVTPEKILLLPNFSEANRKVTLKKTYDYIYVGRMVDVKGISKVLQIFKELGLSKKLTCIGDGPQLEHFRERYPETRILGYLPYDDVINMIGKSKFIVSYSPIEGLPYSILEGMSSGAVPIISRVPGHLDLVIDGLNGFTFSGNNELRNVLFKSLMLDNHNYSNLSNSSRAMSVHLSEYSRSEIKKHFNQYA